MRDVDDGRHRALDVLLLARQLPEHPARQDLLQRAVDGPRGDLRIDITAYLTAIATGLDDPLQCLEEPADLVDAIAHLGAARDLAYEHPHELRRHEPGAEVDAREAAQLLAQRHAGELDPLRVRDELRPRLAEDRLEHLVLRTEVVIEQAVSYARFLGDVADARLVEPLSRKDAHRRLQQLGPPICRPLGHGLAA